MSIMHKLFKPKCLRRIILFLALAFPLVYLTGSFFFALNGSHGNVLLAQEEEVVISSQLVDFNQRLKNGDFSDGRTNWGYNQAITSVSDGVLTADINGTASSASIYQVCGVPVLGHKYFVSANVFSSFNASRFHVRYNGNAFAYASLSSDSWTLYEKVVTINSISTSDGIYGYCYFYFDFDGSFSVGDYMKFDNLMLIDLTQMYGLGNEPTSAQFRAMYPDDYYPYTLSSPQVYETKDVPTYSEYIFNQVFGNDNIITQMGYYALGEQEKGFAPVSSLISFVDGNVFHWGTDNSMMLFVYGYAYYAINTLIVYEIVVIAVKLLLLPLKAVDVFDKGEDIHD